MNSPPVTSLTTSKLPTPGIISVANSTAATADLSPFIKRKCLTRLANNASDSPFMIATGNLNSELAHDLNSPKGLNDRYFPFTFTKK